MVPKQDHCYDKCSAKQVHEQLSLPPGTCNGLSLEKNALSLISENCLAAGTESTVGHRNILNDLAMCCGV
ncbi:hypothetical protein AV530_001015 [Patagioenas fasciata monilis]|uniref:Uncharacterized protein n=1 Tax=Patagioenas fasciata monilis TaxID=372326 RepID=A0A1V4KT88_PATFA|nr:hypothetical protein AV530_001015 [Patagioenas fasciata monilis]